MLVLPLAYGLYALTARSPERWWLPAAGLPRYQAEIAPYPGDTELAARPGPTIRAQLGAGHGATVTLRRPE